MARRHKRASDRSSRALIDPPAANQTERSVTGRQTLVSCLFDLAASEGSGRVSIDRLQRQSEYVLRLEHPMVLFVDPELRGWVRSVRGNYGLASLTHIVDQSLGDLELYATLRRVRGYRTFANSDPLKDTPLYQVLGWSKLDLVRRVIAENPFETGHFAWIDIGIGKVARPPLTFPAPSDRVAILQMKAVAPRELEDEQGFFEYERGRLAAGFFRGGRESLLELAGAFQAGLDEVLATKLRPNEQMVLSALGARRPDLFDFYYGGYASILRNWDQVRDDVATVFLNVAHCREQGLWPQALELCQRIEASAATGALALSADERARLLDEYYVASWHIGQGPLAQAMKREFRRTSLGTSYFAENRERIVGNFALMSEAQPDLESERQTLGLCMIVRNEAATIERCIASVRHLIDHWVICDTGSTDDTAERVRRALDGVPGTLYERPWRDFGANRTELMALSRGTADYLLLLDADMTLKQTEPLPRLSGAAYSLRFDGPLGYLNPRIVRGDREWHYVGSTHEYLASEEPFEAPELGALLVEHHADGGSRHDKFHRDLELLGRDLEARPDDARTVFYLAQTHRDLGHAAAALELFERRAGMGGFAEEAFYAAYEAGVILAREDPARGIGALFAAWQSRPSRAEPLYEVAVVARGQCWWPLAHLAAERGRSIPPPGDSLFVHRWMYEWGLLLEYSIASWWIGDRAAALDATEQLLAVPDLPAEVAQHARDNYKLISGAPWGAPVLRETADDARFAEIRLDVDPAWPQFNPSIAAGGDLGFRMIVRTANYELRDGGYRKLSDGPIQTLNYLVGLNPDLSLAGIRPLLDLEAGPPRHDAQVIGFEDCRLIEIDGGWWATATVRDRNPEQRAQVALLGLEDDRVESVRVLDAGRGARDEKNWMPFEFDGQLHVLYSVAPTIVYRVEPETGELRLVREEPGPAPASDLRGGSQGVAFDGGVLFAAHEVGWGQNGRNYAHRLVLLGADLCVAALTPPFYFLGPGIEYCAGIALHERGVVFSFGCEDRTAWLGVVSRDDIRRLFDSA